METNWVSVQSLDHDTADALWEQFLFQVTTVFRRNNSMPGRVFLRGDMYWIAFYCKGRKYRTSAKTTKKREAENILAFYLGKVARGEFREFERKEMSLSLTELLNDFEEDCKERGLAGYSRIHSHLNPVRAYFKDIAAAQVNERCIGLYRKYRLSLGRTRATINREVQYLSQALKLAVKKKLLTTAPEIEKYQEKNARQGFFEVEDFERVVPLLLADIQDLVRFGYYSGWRRGEIAQLEWSDVEEEIIRLRPEISKTRDGRILSLVGEIADIIARRRTVRRSDVPWVFYRFRKGKFWPVGRFDKVGERGVCVLGWQGGSFTISAGVQ